jgi:hypothetical protein
MIFWGLMVSILCIRITILITRVRFILSTAGGGSLNSVATSAGDLNLQSLVDHLHVGYFTTIALVECTCAFFLLREFSAAKRTSVRAAIKTGLFSYLMRSTEIRVALLAVVGVMRAITYSFQSEAQEATNVPSQLDRFAYTLECMFPLVMLVDMLASRVVFAGTDGSHSGDRSRSGTARRAGNGGGAASSSSGGRAGSNNAAKKFGYGGGGGGATGRGGGGGDDDDDDDVDMQTYPYSGSARHRGEGKHAAGIVTATTKLSSDKASSQEFIIDGTGPLRRASGTSEADLGNLVSVERGDGRGARAAGGGGAAGFGGGISKTVEFEVFEGHRGSRSPV